MGIWDLKAAQPDSLRVQQVATAAPTTWGENFKEQLDTWITGRNPVFISPLRDRINRSNQYSKITEGRGLYADAIEWRNNNFSRDEAVKIKSNEAVNKYIEHLRQQDPTKWSALETDDEVKRQKIEVAKREQAEADLALAGATRMTQLTTPFVSGMAASFMDPINIATMPIGAAGGASILKIALTEAAVNAATEVAEAPIIAPWQREIGNKYGFSEILQDAGTAAVAGFVFSGAIAGASRMAGLDQASAKLKDMGQPEGADAAKYLSRHEHIEANNLAKAETPEIPVAKHQAAMTEVAEAHANGRPIDNSKIPITTDDILNIDTAKIRDPELKATVEKFQAEPPDIDRALIEPRVKEIQTKLGEIEARIEQNKINPESTLGRFIDDAKAEGFNDDLVLFHGGPKNIDEFRVSGDYQELGEGVYLAFSESTADGFGPKTYAVLHKGEIFDIDGSIDFNKTVLDWDKIEPELRASGWADETIENFKNDYIINPNNADPDKVNLMQQFHDVLEDNGYTGIAQEFGGEGQVVIFNPDNIRIIPDDARADVPFGEALSARRLVGEADELRAELAELNQAKQKYEIVDQLMRDPFDNTDNAALKTARELEDYANDPMTIAREADEFNALDDNDLIYLGENNEAVKVKELKELFADEDSFLDAITVCGL